jgi:ACS family glucarate transporter-like MFS transporter
LGAGEAIFYPATSEFVARWIPVQERGIANGFIFAGVGLGAGLTPPIVTAIITTYGWRASFWFSALIGIAAGAVWYFGSRDIPEEHPFVSTRELAVIHAGLASQAVMDSEAALEADKKSHVPWTAIFSSKEMLGVTVSYFSFGYVAWIFFGWFFIYLAEVRGLNLKASAIYSMFPFLGMTVGCLLGGVLSDWLVRHYNLRLGRCWLGTFSLVLTAVLLVIGARTSQAQTASLILACGAAALYLSQSCFWAVTVDIGGKHAGVISGIMNMGGQIAGAVTTTLTPLIAEHFGWNMSFFAAALLAVVGGLSWLLVDPERQIVSA